MKQVESLNDKFHTLDKNGQKQFLCEVLGDDWAGVVRGLSSAVLPQLWTMVKKSSYGQKALSTLRDYLGLDLNDDHVVLGNTFNRNASYQRAVNWSDFSSSYASGICKYDGVNIQAITSMLMPEY